MRIKKVRKQNRIKLQKMEKLAKNHINQRKSQNINSHATLHCHTIANITKITKHYENHKKIAKTTKQYENHKNARKSQKNRENQKTVRN